MKITDIELQEGVLEMLRKEALAAGDYDLADRCTEALGGCSSALQDCIDAVLSARAMDN